LESEMTTYKKLAEEFEKVTKAYYRQRNNARDKWERGPGRVLWNAVMVAREAVEARRVKLSQGDRHGNR